MGKREALEAAAFAAKDAMGRERGRCLWLLDMLLVQLESDFHKKLLMGSERHYAETKLSIARVIVRQAKLSIISGKSPPTPKEEA